MYIALGHGFVLFNSVLGDGVVCLIQLLIYFFVNFLYQLKDDKVAELVAAAAGELLFRSELIEGLQNLIK